MGYKIVGDFEIPGTLAREWLSAPRNPNGRPNSDVIKPWRIARDLMQKDTDSWIIDFGTQMSEADAAFYAPPYAHLSKANSELQAGPDAPASRDAWWRFERSRPAMRSAIAPFDRVIATPKVSRHRIFIWLETSILASQQFYVFARDDDTFFGILHSRFHHAWSMARGSIMASENPSYTPTATFETFPFPEHLTPNLPAETYAANPHAIAIAEAARALVAARDAWLNPPDLVDRVPEVVPGFPDRIVPKNAAAAARLRGRTLTALYNSRGTPEGAWLDSLHAALDAAVAAAYGFASDIPEEEALARLLALNQARAAAQAPAAPRPRRRPAPTDA